MDNTNSDTDSYFIACEKTICFRIHHSHINYSQFAVVLFRNGKFGDFYFSFYIYALVITIMLQQCSFQRKISGFSYSTVVYCCGNAILNFDYSICTR